MSKTRNLFGKIFMIAFLVMVVVGFTVPIVLNNITPDSNMSAECMHATKLLSVYGKAGYVYITSLCGEWNN